MIKPLFKATQVALSPAFTGSIVRKQWLKTPHSWLNLSAILTKLTGHSTGGMLALVYAVMRDDRNRMLKLVESYFDYDF